ncbi:MAG: DUF4293 domain-containing protein [Cyclobacteriaceae bacterium]
MIQRIQSIFLLLVAIVMITILFLPFWQEANQETKEIVTINAFELVYAESSDLVGDKVIDTKPTWYISALAVLAAIVAMFSIFQFKNRLRQIQLGALNSLLIGGNIGLIYYFSTKGEPIIQNHRGDFLPGFFVIAAALFFNALANRFIRKDDKLVKSADRIR